MIFQFQRRTHNMNVMSVLLLGWTLWDPPTGGPVHLKAFFSTSPRLTEKHWRAKQYIIYRYIYICIYIKQFQEATTTTTPLIHGPSKKATTWPNTSQEKWNSLRSDAVESAPVAAPDAAQDHDGKGPRAAAVEGWWNIYIYIYIYIFILYYIYIYITIWYYMILYDTIYDTICIYLNIIQYQHDVNM